jgi:hypothetical protein
MALTMEPLQERLDALLESHESPVMRDVLAYQRDHAAYVSQNYGRTVDLLELCFCLFAEIVNGLNYADKSR